MDSSNKKKRKNPVQAKQSRAPRSQQSASGSTEASTVQDGDQPPAKRKPGRPPKYPNMTAQQKKEMRRQKIEDETRRRLEEMHSKTIVLKDARIHEICDLPLPGEEFNNDSQKVFGNNPTKWTSRSLEDKQVMRDSIHGREHFYILKVVDPTVSERYGRIIRSEYWGIPKEPEPPGDPHNPNTPMDYLYNDFRYYKVGPVVLPFVSNHYVFDIEIQRRPDDYKIKDEAWNSLKRAIHEPARPPVPGSFKLNVEKSFPVWPPTAGFLVRIFKANFHDNTTILTKNLLDNKLLDYKLKVLPKNHGGYYRERDQVESSTVKVSNNTVIHTMERFDALTFAYARYRFHPGVTDCTEGEYLSYHLLQERCVWLFREYFLGPEYFEMCKFFHPIDLVNQSRDRLLAIVPDMLKGGSARRVSNLILNKFLRPDMIGCKFRDGGALVRFVDERVENEEVLENILPPWADPEAFGKNPETRDKKNKSSEASAMSRCAASDLFAGLLTTRLPDVIIRNPSSREALATWYDQLRKVYSHMVALPFAGLGELFPSVTIQREEVEYVEFMVMKEFISIFPNLQEVSHSIRLVQKHLDFIQRVPSSISQSGTPDFEASKKHSISRLLHTNCDSYFNDDTSYEGQDIFGSSDNSNLSGRLYSNTRPFFVAPSAVGARAPVIVYPKMAAELAQNVMESVLDLFVCRYEKMLCEEVKSKVTSMCKEILMQDAPQPREELTVEETQFIDYIRSALGNDGRYGQNAELIIDPLIEILLTKTPDYTMRYPSEEARILARCWPPMWGPKPPEDTGFSIMTRKLVSLQQEGISYGFGVRVRIDQAQRQFGIDDPWTLQLGKELSHYPVVLVDYPFSYAESKRSGPDLLDLARTIADYNLSVEDVHLLDYFTHDSRLYKRLDSPHRIVCLREVEKWTLQQLKEVLQTCFYDWKRSSMISGDGVLWVFADFNALDVGCLSLLENFARDKPHVKRISLRERIVESSGMSNLATQIKLHEALDDKPEFSYLICSKTDDETLTKEWYVEDPITKQEKLYAYEDVPVPSISLDSLHLYRNPEARPKYARVQLSSIADWRQLYTLTCYVTDALILVGTESMLQRIYNTSGQDFYLLPEVLINKVVAPQKPLKYDDLVEAVVTSTSSSEKKSSSGRIRFAPSVISDIWTSLRAPPISVGLPDGLRINVK